MSGVVVSNGTRLSICLALPAAATPAGFGALAFTPVRGVRTLGDLSEQCQTQSANVVNLDYPLVYKTFRGASEVPIELFKLADAGQSLLRQAFDLSGAVSFRLDAPDGEVTWFTALVVGRGRGGFTAGSIADCKAALVLTGPPLVA